MAFRELLVHPGTMKWGILKIFYAEKPSKSEALHFKYTPFDFLSLNDVTALKMECTAPPPV